MTSSSQSRQSTDEQPPRSTGHPSMRVRFRWNAVPSVKARCFNIATRPGSRPTFVRYFADSPPLASGQDATRGHEEKDAAKHERQDGAMSRRLREMTEDTIDHGGRSAARNVRSAGFSAELKKQFEERISGASTHRSQNRQAFVEVEMPSSAGKGTRDQALAEPWAGSESLHDSALRMLDDSHKRLRGTRTTSMPPIAYPGPRPEKATPSTAQRLANARDRTSTYAAAVSNETTKEERAQMRQELKDRFTPGARPMLTTTLQGLTNLANQRIEDAIARGQFQNITRGKGKNVERDHNASSPFLDTTEYLMNKIIQKQQIVPPWIEKQQELVRNVASFRARLRNDWKRHAARSIASEGGSLESQIRRAEGYALAEESINTAAAKDNDSDSETSTEDSQSNLSSSSFSSSSSPPPSPQTPPQTPPFRDPTWLKTESTYHTHAITTLNNLTRSYNLQAPRSAQRPYYYNLARELRRCYADVAPHLPDEIRLRALVVTTRLPRGRGRRDPNAGGSGGGNGSGSDDDDDDDDAGGRRYYGFRRLWRDWLASFSSSSSSSSSSSTRRPPSKWF